MEQTHQPKLYQGRGEGEKSVYLEKKIFFVGVEFWFFSTALGRIFFTCLCHFDFPLFVPLFFFSFASFCFDLGGGVAGLYN